MLYSDDGVTHTVVTGRIAAIRLSKKSVKFLHLKIIA